MKKRGLGLSTDGRQGRDSVQEDGTAGTENSLRFLGLAFY